MFWGELGELERVAYFAESIREYSGMGRIGQGLGFRV
jgi:hypothetical protein